MRHEWQTKRRGSLWLLFPLMKKSSRKCHLQSDNGELAGGNNTPYCSGEELKNDDMTILVG